MQAGDEKEVGIIRTCMQNEKSKKNQRRYDGDAIECREWMDDTTDWCQTDVHRLSLLAQDRDT